MDSVLVYATQALLEQRGVAAVEELEIKRRWGRARSVKACIRIHGGVDARDVCRSAAEALGRLLHVADVCLVTALARAETASREGAL
jgi:hypothetical protein